MVLKSAERPMREIELSAKRLKQAELNLCRFLMSDVITHNQRYGACPYAYQYD
jgi:hypothetical protein